MFKKLCILLIFSKLKVTKHLIDKYRMHNLYAIFAKLLNICKQIADNTMTDRRKTTSSLCNTIRERMEANIPSFCQSEKKN